MVAAASTEEASVEAVSRSEDCSRSLRGANRADREA